MKGSEINLVEASQMFRNGEIRNALQLYITLSNKYYDTSELTKQQYNQLAGIQATIGIIHIALGNYEEAIQNLQKVLALNQLYELDSLIIIRSLTNLITIDIIRAKFDDALEKFNIIKNIIVNTERSSSLIKMIYRIFFRVENLDDISQILEIARKRKITLIEAVSISSLIWSHNICEDMDQNAIEMQQLCYKIFLQNQRYDYAISAIRHILRCLQNQEEKAVHYKKQLKKIMTTGIAQECQIENQQVILTIQTIYSDLKELNKASSEIQMQHKHQNIYDLLWRKAILYVLKNHTQHQASSLQDENIKKTFDMILSQKNQLLIKQIKKTDFLDAAFKEYCFAIDKTYSNIDRKIHDKNRINCHYFLIQMRMFNDYKQRISLSPTPSRNKVFKNRENLPQYGISITNKQSQSGNSKNISPLKSKDVMCSQFNTKRSYLQKKKTKVHFKLSKMLRFCQHGAFLNKKNFNSDGGQYKFVKITSTQIKWSKNPEKIDGNCHSYELKDVRSIIYGKVTPILNKLQNKVLKPYLCFSLLLQKRTLDFYCNSYEEVQNWICGLTVALHKLNVPVVGYTPGKLLWRKALMKLKSNFVQPLKPHERNCFFLDNAYAVVQFGKNNYKLPSN